MFTVNTELDNTCTCNAHVIFYFQTGEYLKYLKRENIFDKQKKTLYIYIYFFFSLQFCNLLLH